MRTAETGETPRIVSNPSKSSGAWAYRSMGPIGSMSMDLPEDVVGVLLAGGRSSRMGGGDKCLLPLGGQPMLAHIIDRLRPQVSDLVINANGDVARFAAFGLPVIEDRLEGRCRSSGSWARPPVLTWF